MGWTSCYKPPCVSAADFLKQRWDSVPNREIVATQTVGRVVYMALRVKNPSVITDWYVPEPDGSIVVALVYLTSTDRDTRYNFRHKDLDETCGPFAASASPSFLAKLSKPQPYTGDPILHSGHRNAIEWRENCRATARRKREAIRLVVGMEVSLDYAVEFGDTHIQHFKVASILRNGKNVLCFLNNTPGARDTCYYQLRPGHKKALRLTNPPAPGIKPVILVHKIGERPAGRFQLKRKMPQ